MLNPLEVLTCAAEMLMPDSHYKINVKTIV